MNTHLSPEGVHVVVLETGDEAMDSLVRFAASAGVEGAGFTGLGAFSSATLAYFDVDVREYIEIPIPEQSEVLSLAGDIGLEGGRPKVHAHAVLGFRDGSVKGGHLLRATVRPTLEVVVTETDRALRRRFDPGSGLALIDLTAREGSS
jgi:predicted DNA-binding protein with PD1-like motif